MAENSSTDAEGSSHSDKTVDCVDVRPNSTINYIHFFSGEIAGWSDWSDWSACSTSCGSGTQYSSRTCVNSNVGSSVCTGNSYRLQNCTSQFCQRNYHLTLLVHDYLKTVMLFYFWQKLARYLCWWTIDPRGYQLPSSQCFATTWFNRYIYYRNLQFLNNVIIIK
jgi:hypothetical protein